jgi:hypothetical protein
MVQRKTEDMMKKAACIALLLVITAAALSAQESIAVLDTWGAKIIGLLKATWLQATCALALAIEGGSMLFAQQHGEGGTIRKLMPWMIGTIVLLTASGITEFFFSSAA